MPVNAQPMPHMDYSPWRIAPFSANAPMVKDMFTNVQEVRSSVPGQDSVWHLKWLSVVKISAQIKNA